MFKVRIDVIKKLNKAYAEAVAKDSTRTSATYNTDKAYHYVKIEGGKRIYNSIEKNGRKRRTVVKEGLWITQKLE